MKVRIEFDDSLDQVEVVIRTSQLVPEIEQIQQALQQISRPSLVFTRGVASIFFHWVTYFSLKRTEPRFLLIQAMMPTRLR